MSESRRTASGRVASVSVKKRGGYESSSKSVTRLAAPPVGPAPGAKSQKTARPTSSHTR